MWLVEEQTWDEVADILRLAAHCGRCILPVRLTADDINKHANKTAYLAAPHGLAQLKMVGPHIDFGNGVTFQLFQHGNTLRAIKDEDGFEMDTNPPLPPNHLYRQHRQEHDPPVRSRIGYRPHTGRVRLAARDYAYVSSMVKSLVINHILRTQQHKSTSSLMDRYIDNNRLHTIVTQSPHISVEGCTTTASYRSPDGWPYRHLVLTDAGHPFVARILIEVVEHLNIVCANVTTTESAVSDVGGAFKDRFPQTTRLARAVLGPSSQPGSSTNRQLRLGSSVMPNRQPCRTQLLVGRVAEWRAGAMAAGTHRTDRYTYS
ncbi:unnamed protein product [Vitrella brassicaformis CCMP3155]|uniref:Uncharacterized protein n=1 Tax=Vitrella brassicaformis (strain CCMP3155) TaxID=1169540 RepID=A0A0G4GNW1_VITBC|nr:unnamed protein product [Vitrella brassicaformis CCMP3155]|eukprot:CEM31859.1 unnamed protein product [Vitrella brassicaformis CCMP3155]